MSLEGWLIPWWVKALGVLAIAGLVAWGCWHVYHSVTSAAYTAGYNARVAKDAAAQASNMAKQKATADAGAKVSQAFHAQVDTQIPKIEETTSESAAKVKIIYKNVPMPVACTRPDGVMHELDAARARANAAAAAQGGL